MHPSPFVVIIDDDPISILVSETIMRKSNFSDRIKTFPSAEKALDFFKTYFAEADAECPLIFLDIQMPKMDGWGFIDAYRNMDPSTSATPHIIMLSAATDPDDTVRSDNEPLVIQFMAKPVTTEILQELRELKP